MNKAKYLLLILCVSFTSFFFTGCNDVKVQSVQFNQQKITLALGESGFDLLSNVLADNTKLVATAMPFNAKNRTIKFTIADQTIAKIENGKIVPISEGVTYITATAIDVDISTSATIQVVQNTQQLSKVENIRFENNKIIWDEVENADFYTVRINNAIQGVTVLPEFSQFNSGISNSVEIQAGSVGTAYRESEYSNAITFKKLNAPQNITNQDYNFAWDNEEDATGYDVYVDETKINTQPITQEAITLSQDLLNDGKTHKFYVKAIGDADNNIFESDLSAGYNVEVLKAPTILNLTQGVVMFNQVACADSYRIKIGDNFFTSKPTTFAIPDEIASGEHKLSVQAIATKGNYISSEYSSLLSFTKLDAVSELYLENTTIKWDKVVNAGGYIIEVNDKKIDLGVVSHFDIGEDYSAGEYKVRVACVGTGSEYVMSNFSETATFTKLATPENFSVVNGKIRFNEVENASSYIVSVNGQEKEISKQQSSDGIFNVDLSLESGNYNLKVKAIGDGETYLNSAYTNTVNTTKLVKPETPYLEGGLIKWKTVISSFGYNVKINDVVHQYNSLETVNGKVILDLSSEEFTDEIYNVQVQAISREDNINSDYSETAVFRKYQTPTDIQAVKGNLSFKYNSNIENYIISVNSINFNVNSDDLMIDDEINPSLYLYDFNFSTYTSAPLSIRVGIKGNDEYIASSMSESIQFTMSAPLSNLNIADNILSFKNSQEGKILASYQGKTSLGGTIKEAEQETVQTTYALPNFLGNTLLSGTYKFSFRVQGASANVLSGALQTISTTILETPANLRVEEGYIQWDATTNASSYNLKVIDASDKTTLIKDIYITSRTYYVLSAHEDIETGKDYVIAINAIGNGSKYISSVFTDTADYVTVNVLSAPTNVRVENGDIAWDNVANGEMYGMYVDGKLVKYVANYAQLLQDEIPTGSHDIMMYAYGDSVKYLTSANSAPFNIIKLQAPENLNIKKNSETEKATLYCDIPTNATSIDIMQEFGEETNTTNYISSQFDGVIEVDVSALNSGYHSFTARSIGDSTKYISSSESMSCGTTVMAAPESVTVDDGVINWSNVTGVSTYTLHFEYYGEDGTLAKTEIVKTEIGVNSYVLGTEFVEGYYKFSIKAIGDESRFISSQYSAQKDIIKLGLPSQLDTYKGEIVFNPVEGAGAYNIFVDSNYYQVLAKDITILSDEGVQGKITFELPASVSSGTHSIMVQAVGDDTMYVTGEAGATISVSDTLIDVIGETMTVTKLASVKEFRLDDGTLKWTPTEVASGYRIQINAVELEEDIQVNINNAYFELEDRNINAGEKLVKVKAIGQNTAKGERILNSNYTTAIKAIKLETVTGLQATYEQDINKCGTLIWDAVSNNNGYLVTVTYGDGSVKNIVTEKDFEHCELIDEEILSGEVKVNVKALGNSTDDSSSTKYISGSKSDEKSFSKIATPSNFRIQDGKLFWDYENGYKFVVSVTTNGEETFFEVEEQSAEIDTSYTSGTYKIKVKAQGKQVEEGLNQLNSSYTNSINAIKPEMPTNVTVDEYGIVQWNTVKNAASYVVIAYHKPWDDEGEFTEDDDLTSHTGLTENIFYLGERGRYKFTVAAVSEQGLYSEKTSEIEFLLDGFIYGSGTVEQPYQVATVEDFQRVAKYPKAHFIQTEDIDLSSVELQPMFIDEPFEGTYNGQNFNLENISITFPSVNSLGLFSTISGTGIVQNLNLVNTSFKLGSSKVGGIAGTNNGKIINCSVSGQVIATTISTNDSTEINVGGIAGYNTANAIVSNCYANVTIKGIIENTELTTRSAVTSGGICATNYGTIYQSYTDSQSIIYGNIAGGIVGFNACRVEQCFNAAYVCATNITFATVERNGYAGGIAGLNSNTDNTIIYNCYNLGSVACEDNASVTTNNYSLYAGGITARNNAGNTNEAKIVNCYDIAIIQSGSTNGISYYNTAICYNDGTGYINYVYSVDDNTAVYNGNRNVRNNVQFDNAIDMQTEDFAATLNSNIGVVSQDSNLANFNLSNSEIWVMLDNGYVGFTWQAN